MTSHGRAGLTNPVNPGAPTTGSPFPNTNPAIALTNAGATMAQTLGAHYLYGERHDPERRHHAVLADLEHGCDLRRHLDRRHHAAASGYALLVHLFRSCRTQRIAADQFELRAVERAMPHHDPLRHRIR